MCYNLFINKALTEYIDKTIIPFYQKFISYKVDHVRYVIRRSLDFAKQVKEPIDLNMVYAIAAFHDIGESKERKTHEIIGAQMLLEDKKLSTLFTSEQMKIMSQAVEDHRASSDREPHSIYGKIVSSADRTTSVDDILRLSHGFRKKHNPDFTTEETMIESKKHIQEKFGKTGYALEKMYFKDPEFEHFIKEIHALLKDNNKFKQRYFTANNLSE